MLFVKVYKVVGTAENLTLSLTIDKIPFTYGNNFGASKYKYGGGKGYCSIEYFTAICVAFL